ncbi:hypothetical protein BD779DRAFT_1807685 [Infundibulicybe gibba]|nr:hypothetical protein BD779DRAFT_1807685 [Infundibulicybe gibba]
MPPLTFAEVWGSIAICLLVSSVLNGCIAMQACSYFLRFSNDVLVLKCAVAVVWLGSMLHLASMCWVLHSVIILGYDQPFYDVIIPLGLSISIAIESIMHSAVQGTYIFRMYRFGQNRYILAPCCMLVLLQLGFGFTWAARVAVSETFLLIFARNQEMKWIVTSFFTICASVDLFITVSLTSQLMWSRKNGLKRTKSLIDNIMRWTIPTGMLTRCVALNLLNPPQIIPNRIDSVVAITIVLVWNLQGSESLLGVAICIFEPDCYVICLLALLNARSTHAGITDLPMVTVSATSTGWHADASSSSGTAVATTVHDLSTPPRKVIQIADQVKPQDGYVSKLEIQV